MDGRGMVHKIVVANHAFRVVNSISFRRARDLVRAAGQAKYPRVKGAGVVDEHWHGIALRVDRDEERLDTFGERPELAHRLGDVAERCRADIRTMRVAEEDRQPLAAEVPIRDFAPGCGVDQLERPAHRWTLAPMQPKNRSDG